MKISPNAGEKQLNTDGIMASATLYTGNHIESVMDVLRSRLEAHCINITHLMKSLMKVLSILQSFRFNQVKA